MFKVQGVVGNLRFPRFSCQLVQFSIPVSLTPRSPSVCAESARDSAWREGWLMNQAARLDDQTQDELCSVLAGADGGRGWGLEEAGV
jgi:hypothetical protein